MAVTFILGRGGTGKTRYCLEAVQHELDRVDEQRRLILLVPEQASFQMERTLATRCAARGFVRAEVLSFSRLARRVLEHGGATPEVLGPQGRALALRHIVAQCGESLGSLRGAVRQGGFFAQLDRLIDELLREDVHPDALRTAAARLDDAATARRVEELAELYAAYLNWLGPQRTDAAAQLSLLRARLEQVEWLRNASLWVDGFAGFTGQELQTLVSLARVVRDVSITLLVDPAAPAVRDARQRPDELGLFQRTEQTYQSLRRLLDDAGVTIAPPVLLTLAPPPRFVRAPGLATLEAGLATPVAAAERVAAEPPTEIRLCECATHRDELRAAARWVRTQIADSGGALRFRDFAVIARDLEALAPLVSEVFAEYEIPYFLDRRRPLRGHPLSRLLPALFEAVRTDFATEPMVRVLRTRLLPLSRDENEQLENVVVRAAVRGAALWRQARWDLETPHTVPESVDVRRLEIVAALEPLVSLIERGGRATGAAWATALYGVLQTLGVRGQVETWIAEARAQQRWESAELHRLAWEALCELLDGLHGVLADTTLTTGDVVSVVTTALGEQTLGLAPPTLDQVLVSSIERSRHPDIRYAWVLAFNEGIFPARPGDDVLLSSTQRDALAATGLAAPTARRDDAFGERLLAYIAFTRPSDGLVISYATVSEEGDALLPSPLLTEVAQVLPGLRVERMDEGQPPVCLHELAAGHLRVRAGGDVAEGRYARLGGAVRGDAHVAAQLDWLLRGTAYANRPAAVGNYRRPAHAAENVVWRTSASEIETLLQCPFKHFARFGLRLDPQRGPRPLRWDLGSAAHEILADVTQRALREARGVRAVTDERWQTLLEDAVAAFWQRQAADLVQRRPDYVFMTRCLTTLLRDVVTAHVGRWRRGGCEPYGCELAFDPQRGLGVLAGLDVTLPDGRHTHVHGKIDRLDVVRANGKTLLFVYDYKSRAGTVRSTFLTGERLQLFIYLLAAEQALGGNAAIEPAGVFLAPLYPDLGALKRKYVAEATPAEQVMYMLRPRGVFTEVAAPLLDEALGPISSPVAQMQLKKDGGFYAASDTVSPERLQAYLKLARDTIAFAAAGIADGTIDVAPLVENKTLACSFCEFQPVCRFDRALNTPRATEATLPVLAGPAEVAGEEA